MDIYSKKGSPRKGGLLTLTKEEKRIYKLTQNNTLINKDMSKKGRENYLKEQENEYKDIYGNKGINFCKSIEPKETEKLRAKPPTKRNVNKIKFSSVVEYSRK